MARDYARCGWQNLAGPPSRARWTVAVPRVRDGRLRSSEPRWPVHEFAESDYCYGIGPIRLRLTWVGWGDVVPHDGEQWLAVEGIEIGQAGGEGALRRLLIRAGRVPVPPGRKRPRLRAPRNAPV